MKFETGQLMYEEPEKTFKDRRGNHLFVGMVGMIIFFIILQILFLYLFIDPYILTIYDGFMYVFATIAIIIIYKILNRDYSGIKPFRIYENGIVPGIQLQLNRHYSYNDYQFIKFDDINGVFEAEEKIIKGKRKQIGVFFGENKSTVFPHYQYDKESLIELLNVLKKKVKITEEEHHVLLVKLDGIYL